MATRIFTCVKQQALSESPTGVDRGNGKEKHAPVGLDTDGWLYRDEQQFAGNWDGVYKITKAVLFEHTSSGVHIASFGSAPRITVHRNIAAFTEKGGTEGNWDQAPAAATVFPGPNTTGGAGSDSPVVSGRWLATDVTPFADQWAPATVKRTNGAPGAAQANYGIRLMSFDEGSTTRRVEFDSRRGPAGTAPYIELTYDGNAPPNPPTITSPVGSTSPEVIGPGTEDTTSFLFSDPDAGDRCAKVQVQYFGAGATDAATGSVIKDSGAVSPVGAGSLNSFTVKVVGLPARTGMRKRLRAQDNHGAWGGWTSLAEGYIQTAYKPGIPTNPSMGTNPEDAHIFGTLNGPGTISGWEGNFYRDTQAGRITLWASGMVDIGGSSTRSDVTYGGVTLNNADVVKWQHRHRNQDGVVGTWSPEYTTTMHTLVGPAITPSSNATKLLSRTAQITITFDASSDGYQWRLYRLGELLYDSGVVTIAAAASVNVNLPAAKVNWCDDLEIEAAGRPAGTSVMGPFSPRSTLHIDCLPSTTLTVSN